MNAQEEVNKAYDSIMRGCKRCGVFTESYHIPDVFWIRYSGEYIKYHLCFNCFLDVYEAKEGGEED